MLTKKAPILKHDTDLSPYEEGYKGLKSVSVRYVKYGTLSL